MSAPFLLEADVCRGDLVHRSEGSEVGLVLSSDPRLRTAVVEWDNSEVSEDPWDDLEVEGND